jgi:predicted nuclease of restriction endonuclease-like (RecB) superfamily
MNPKTSLILPKSYPTFLEEVKTRIRHAQIKAALAVNQELLKLHWWIGREIVLRQETEKWGSQVLEKFCKDIQSNFPGLKWFSRSNVFYMRTFYKSYAIVQQAAGQLESPPNFCLNIPWWHNVILIDKLKTLQEREWYARAAVEHGWSRSMLELWIEGGLYQKNGKAPNNFQKALPSPQSDLAEQTIRDPYNFDFMTIIKEAREKEIEDGLMVHIQKFLLELGSGFAFVGRQVPLRVGDEDFHIDLLFYHMKLRCYFVIELKAVPFKPEFTGQMNFYLSVVDDKMKNPGDNRSIGLILCKSKKTLTVKYALDGVLSPIGVASYETALAESLPTDLKASLPSIEEIEAETTLYTEKAKLLGKKFNQMTYEDYIAQIAYDDEAKIFHGEVIGLNDVITFQGKSIEELQEAFKASVKDYLALCAEGNSNADELNISSNSRR